MGIFHIRLINGDEIITKILEEDDRQVLVDTPMVVSEEPVGDTNATAIVLSKYVLFDEAQIVPIQKQHIITMSPVMEEISMYYDNSVEYNAKFIEPNVREKIKEVNKALRSVLDASQMQTKQTQSAQVVYLKSANTVH